MGLLVAERKWNPLGVGRTEGNGFTNIGMFAVCVLSSFALFVFVAVIDGIIIFGRVKG